jgi:general secretion pathway protein G
MNLMPTLGKALRAKKHARGVTLIEILIVLAIVGLIAGGIAVAVIPKFAQAQKDTTKTSAQSLQQVADLWRTTHPGECPTAERLKQEKEVGSSSKVTDAWDTPFKILCDDESTQVVSFGPDKKEGTTDDIRIPEGTAQK